MSLTPGLDELARQARINKMTEDFIESAQDPVEALTKRMDAVEQELVAGYERMMRMMRILCPESKDHEWASVDETQNIPRCTCVTWKDWSTGKPGRKHNRFCRFPHRA